MSSTFAGLGESHLRVPVFACQLTVDIVLYRDSAVRTANLEQPTASGSGALR
jgi:hypothetical protein